MIKYILNLLYPPRCIFCKSILDYKNNCGCGVCEACKAKIPYIPEKMVSLMRRNMSDHISRDFLFHDCVSVFYYEGLVAKAICDFKFHNKHFYAKVFASYVCETIKRYYSEIKFDYITYIPMFKSKERKRGFNQAKLLAKRVSDEIGFPQKDLLVKHIDNEAQHRLSLDKRVSNIKGVYKFLNKIDIKDKNILLIDDIITSGSTLNEAAKVLKESGAKIICCATIAAPKIKNRDSLLQYLKNEKIY